MQQQQQQSSPVVQDSRVERGGTEQHSEGAESTLEYFFQERPLSLGDIRSQLIRQEETIIFALIERAQFKTNPTVYNAQSQGAQQQHILHGKSFLDFFFGHIERVHSWMRRYTSPDEHPFYPSTLEPPVLPLLNYAAPIRPNHINYNRKAHPAPSKPAEKVYC